MAKRGGAWRGSCAAGLGGAEAVGERAVTRSVAARGAELQQRRVDLRLVAGGRAEHEAGEAALAASHGPQGVRSARDEPSL